MQYLARHWITLHMPDQRGLRCRVGQTETNNVARTMFAVQQVKGRRIFVDGKELPRIEKDISDRNLLTHQGERTRNLRGRNLDCAILAYADLRYADFSNASMIGATLDRAPTAARLP